MVDVAEDNPVLEKLDINPDEEIVENNIFGKDIAESDDSPVLPVIDAPAFSWDSPEDSESNDVANNIAPPAIPISPTEGLILEIIGDNGNSDDVSDLAEIIDSNNEDNSSEETEDISRIIERRPGDKIEGPYNPDVEREVFDYKTYKTPDEFKPKLFGNKNKHIAPPLYKDTVYLNFFDAAKTGNTNNLRSMYKSDHINDIDMADANGDTALIISTKYSHINNIRYILANGADPDKANNLGIAPIHIAAALGRADIVDALLTKKASLAIEDNNGNTAFDYAFENGNSIIYSMLTKGDFDVNKHLSNGSTFLIMAIKYNNQEKMKHLLAAGADIELKDKNGYTPLMLAAYNGRSYMVDALIGLGADVSVRDDYGRTAADLADLANNRDIFTRLMSIYIRNKMETAELEDSSNPVVKKMDITNNEDDYLEELK